MKGKKDFEKERYYPFVMIARSMAKLLILGSGYMNFLIDTRRIKVNLLGGWLLKLQRFDLTRQYNLIRWILLKTMVSTSLTTPTSAQFAESYEDA